MQFHRQAADADHVSPQGDLDSVVCIRSASTSKVGSQAKVKGEEKNKVLKSASRRHGPHAHP